MDSSTACPYVQAHYPNLHLKTQDLPFSFRSPSPAPFPHNLVLKPWGDTEGGRRPWGLCEGRWVYCGGPAQSGMLKPKVGADPYRGAGEASLVWVVRDRDRWGENSCRGWGWTGSCPACGDQGPRQVTRCVHTWGGGHNCDEKTWVTFTGTDQINKYILSAGQRSYKYETGKNYNELCDVGLELELLVWTAGS